VCILSPHPFVLTEFSRLLAPLRLQMVTCRLDSKLGSELRKLAVPRAPVYVADTGASLKATAALMANLLKCSPSARVLMVAEKFKSYESHDLLQLGVKGLLTYREARDQLSRAVPLVANGGFWVPRSLLSEFIDGAINSSRGPRSTVKAASALSGRQQAVFDSLLENLANKEIASKLNISERTVKFHVANVLNKFGVRRRSDLILLCYQQRRHSP
jgi:DNA-binding NarL/FixJ family response regulator